MRDHQARERVGEPVLDQELVERLPLVRAEGERGRLRDLSDIAGTWRKDLAFDRAVASQDTIDEEMWR